MHTLKEKVVQHVILKAMCNLSISFTGIIFKALKLQVLVLVFFPYVNT